MENSFFNTMMNNCQLINTEENGISFAKEGFDQLFDEYTNEIGKLPNEGTNNLRKGFAIGTVVGGLTVAAVIGVRKYVKNKKQQNKSKKEIKVNLGEVINFVEKSVEIEKRKLNNK